MATARVLIVDDEPAVLDPPSGVPFLPKPFSPAALIAKVKEALAATAQARDALERALDRAQELQAEA